MPPSFPHVRRTMAFARAGSSSRQPASSATPCSVVVLSSSSSPCRRRPLSLVVHVAVGATGDVVMYSSFVDRAVSEGNQRASWFATAGQWPGPRPDTDTNSVLFVPSLVFLYAERPASAGALSVTPVPSAARPVRRLRL